MQRFTKRLLHEGDLNDKKAGVSEQLKNSFDAPAFFCSKN